MAKILSDAGVFLGENIALKQESGKKLRRFIVYLLIVLIFFSGIFFLVWEEIFIIKLTYEIHQLRRSLKELNFYNKKLKFEISSLSSLSRVEREAVEGLKLKSPDSNQVKVIISQTHSPFELYVGKSLTESILNNE